MNNNNTNAKKRQCSKEQWFARITASLASERLNAYRTADSSIEVTIARYMLNIALCESLYAPLQFCEIALRNSINDYITTIINDPHWFASDNFPLTQWAELQVTNAKGQLARGKKNASNGRIVAELSFGFWTSMFEHYYERTTPFLPSGIKSVFPNLPKSQHNRRNIKAKLDRIRILRNRVFHHERIIHWKDLDEKHALILDVISWINPELVELVRELDTYPQIRSAGLNPWIKKAQNHMPV